MGFTAILGLVLKYGPVVLTLIEQYGPTVWNAIAPLVQQSAKQGTLTEDVTKLVESAKALVPLVGPMETVGHVATALNGAAVAIGNLAPEDNGNPTPEQDRLARPHGGH